MLQKHGHYNDLSDKLRAALEVQAKSFGKKVKVKFRIAKENPDPQKYNGEFVYPNKYTLDPRTFRITDPYEDRKNVSKSKQIGLVDKVDREGIPETFHKIVVEYRDQGVKIFNTEDQDDLDRVMFLLMHPKLTNGAFQDKDKTAVFEIVDDKKEASLRKDRRDAKVKALNAVRDMNEKQLLELADAMVWDTTEEIDILKDKAEELAETSPDFFNELVSGKNVQYQALVKRALDKGVWSFDPAEYKFIWSNNQQAITVLSPVGDKNHIEKMSEWLQTGGDRADQVYEKAKELVSK